MQDKLVESSEQHTNHTYLIQMVVFNTGLILVRREGELVAKLKYLLC